MKSVQLHDVAPNGLRTNIITLTEVPNADKSGVKYLIEYQEYDMEGKFKVGRCDLTLGGAWFQEYDKSHYSGVSYKGLKLLAKWIEENLEK